MKPNAYFHIVLRVLYGGLIIGIENFEDIAEAVPDKMSLGLSLSNPMVYPLWSAFRISHHMENSICTRMMPFIVTQLLMCVHHIDNTDILQAFQHNLVSFGTKSFGTRNTRTSSYIENYRTPYYICYAPGELEAITDVSAEMLKGVNSV